ncbi:MAG: efflux RND transporter periplasmic adaptor subunit [Bacillota bacterium]|jgi:RND family efflux transporter MFP subunit
MIANRKMTVLFLALTVLSVCGCKRQAKSVQKAPAKPVLVRTVIGGNYTNTISSSGNIKPAQLVKIAFKIPGTISYLAADEGDYIKKGQLLAELDARQYRLNALAAESNYASSKLKVHSEVPSAINQAKSQLDLITNRYNRYKSLYENGVLPRDKYEALETELQVIQNKYQEALDARAISAKKLDQAKAMSDLAHSSLDDSRIYAPLNGVVVKKLAESGELAATGYPVLVLGELSKVEVEIGVADEYINQLRLGQTAKVYVYGLEREFSGVITEIGAMADEKTRTFPVKFTVNNPNRQLKPGMIAKVTIPLDSSRTILIPVDSVINMPDGSSVFVYVPKSGTVVSRKVVTGDLVKDKIEILEGLRPGEQIVVVGYFKLKNHDRVRVGVKS